MKSLRVVKVDQVAREVRTVVSKHVEPVSVWRRVVLENQFTVLLFAGIDLKTVDGPALGDPEQLRPASAWRLSVGSVGRDRLEMSAAILVSEKVG
jgi:hypothetical protein